MTAICRTCKGSGVSPTGEAGQWTPCSVCNGAGVHCECGKPLERWHDKACAQCKDAARQAVNARNQLLGYQAVN